MWHYQLERGCSSKMGLLCDGFGGLQKRGKMLKPGDSYA